MSFVSPGCGPLPVSSWWAQAHRFALAVVAAAVAGGCAQNSHTATAHDPSVAAPTYQVAAGQSRKADLEDDGREAQIPPMKKSRPEPDDPREPWSPNYGPQRPIARVEPVAPAASGSAGLGAVVRGQLPADLPAEFRRRLASAVDE